MLPITKMIAFLCLMVSISLFLSGCETAPRVEYKNVLVTTPENLIKNCEAEPPPPRDVYLRSTMSEKERLLTEAQARQYTKIDACNKRLSEARAWNHKQEKLYGTTPSPKPGG